MRLASIALLLALLAACGDAGGPSVQLLPAHFAVVGGANQIDTVAQELKDMIAVQVIATDDITPVPNYPITWTALDGGSVFAIVVNSGTDGVARQRWTLGTRSGTQRLVARALDGETGAVLVDDTVSATGMPDVAAELWTTFGPNPHPLGSNHLTVGDTGLVVFWYEDRWHNHSETCADGGSIDRLSWTSSDSSIVRPLGATTVLPDGKHVALVLAIAPGNADITTRANLACAPSVGGGSGVRYKVVL